MEFPDLGKHCSDPNCKQLDYLPVKCQYCKKDYCNEHFKPNDHNCTNAPSEDGVKVPVCPVCNQPIPVAKGEDPNIRMNIHIENDCNKPVKSTSKPFNSCSFGKCKNRIAVKIMCSGCGKSYCIKHRLEPDHKCEEIQKENKLLELEVI
ncbi:9746_t:CDS:2 [Entrophospora sp. SA101]|nr:9746_t:CDS:2 [Entrophospora sp. SA101]